MSKEEMYCPHCEQYVAPEKEWPMKPSWGIAIFGLLGATFLGLVFGGPTFAMVLFGVLIVGQFVMLIINKVISSIGYAIKDPKCPICGTKNLYKSERKFRES